MIIETKMQREISNEIFFEATISPFDDVGNSSAIDRIASNYTDAKEKVKKNKRTHQHWKI